MVSDLLTSFLRAEDPSGTEALSQIMLPILLFYAPFYLTTLSSRVTERPLFSSPLSGTRVWCLSHHCSFRA